MHMHILYWCCSNLEYVLLQERSPLALAVPGALPFDGVPYGSRCTVNRSASMDSDISSFSPIPKRHRLCPSEAPSDAGSAQFDCHYAQHQDSIPPERASTTEPALADAQKAYALKLMLSQSSPEEAAALITFLQGFQRLRHSSASQHSQAQPLCRTLPSTVGQPAAQYSNRLPPSTILKLQAAYGQVVQATQQQHACDTLPQHMVADSRKTCLDAFMTQLREIQTPAQHGQESSSTGSYSHPAAAAWYDNPAVPAEPSTAAYKPVQPQIEAYWSAYRQEHKPSQPDFMWQSAAAVAHCSQASATVREAHAIQAPVAVASHLLNSQQQAMLHQLAEQKRLGMQQHMAREQQAFLERQAVLVPVRPALSFPDLVAYWAKGLSLQRCESVYLACHLWTRVQQQVSYNTGTSCKYVTVPCHRCFSSLVTRFTDTLASHHVVQAMNSFAELQQ